MNPSQRPAPPIAVIGMACRLPGGIDTPDDLWEFLMAGKDAIGEVPPERWAAYARRDQETANALRGVTRRGGFLADAAGFDADFFGITPREAELMDPQQRIMLELGWESLEHAGIDPHTLAGSDAAVYVGVGSDDYGRQLLEDLPRIEAWTGIGAAQCAVANRISYTLDLRGPSFSVDTACSSSLVALHLACAGLRDGECAVALAGGVNVIAGPGLSKVLDEAGATSAQGRSRPFDAEADGYGRGEGAGIVVLKRLSDAEADGDRILAVIRGSAVNQDGRTRGIMAPNGAAQAQVARLALRQGGVDAGSVAYVEAHGTGTPAGDPVEAAALGEVYGAGRRPGDPCLIGSVKGNIGHLEAGAGIAGVIKAVLALGHGMIPPQAGAGISAPNPEIPWETTGLRLVTEPTPWPEHAGPRRAGVSAFGYGGTVGHVVLEQAPARRPVATRPESAAPQVFPLSGRTEAAVREYAGRLAEFVGRDSTPEVLADLRHTLWNRRARLPSRAAVVAHDSASLRYELRKLATDQPSAGISTGTAPPGVPEPVVWVFSGHGSQWSGMARELLLGDPDFAGVIDTIDPIFRQEAGFSAREALLDGELGGVDRIQSLLFAVHCGLAAVWRRLGSRPAAVLGHSVGEVAAAVVAGVLDLEQGARLICRRSARLRAAAGGGAMAMAALPFAEVEALLAGQSEVVAAIESSPVSTVVSGTPDAVAAFTARCGADGVAVRPVASDVAFHSPQMEPLLAGLQADLAGLTPAAPSIPLYSTALADPRADAPRDAGYWALNLREPVRLATAIEAAVADGHRFFLEVSPHPVVSHSIGETLAELGAGDAYVTGSLRRGRPELATLLTSLAELHCHGGEAVPPAPGELITLPRVAWRHRRYWRAGPDAEHPGAAARWHDPASAGLLGAPVTVAVPGAPRIWQTRLDDASRPYPGRHPVQGVEIVPAAALLNTLSAAVDGRALSGVRLLAPLAVSPAREVQVLRQDEVVTIASRPLGAEEDHWQTHATATSGTAAEESIVDIAAARERCGVRREPGVVLESLVAAGIASAGFGWTVTEVRTGDGELLATVRPDGETAEQAWAGVVDAALSAAPLVFGGEPVLRIADRVDRVSFAARPPAAPVLRISVCGDGVVDVQVLDDEGRVAGVLAGLRYRTLDGGAETGVDRQGLVHRLTWSPVTRQARPLRRLVVFGADDGLTEGFTGVECLHLTEIVELANLLGELDDRDAIAVVPAAEPADAAPGAITAAAAEAAWTLTRVAQLLAGRDLRKPPRLWAVTKGVREGAGVTHSVLWGLGRVIGGQYPGFWGGIVDLPDAGAAGLAEVLGGTGEADVFAPREGVVEAARLVPLDGDPERPALRCRPDATYLITGGLGVLGLRVAAWLADRGARRLVLTARTPVPPRAEWPGSADPRVQALRVLEDRGVTVRTLALDVADERAARMLADPDALGLPPIRGVVHAAGVLDDRMLDELDYDSLAAVLRPKARGALVLDRLFPPGSVDFFALFSSFGQFLGLPGQAAYASANAFLDAVANRRAAAGHADALSLCWTSWRGMGMAVSEVVDAELRHAAVTDISADEAFRAWLDASRHRVGQVAVFGTTDAPHRRPPVLTELRSEVDTEDDGTGVLAGLTGEERLARLVEEITAQIAAEMRLPVAELDARRPLTALGLDSVMTLSIRRRLETRFGLGLPATLLWKLPTVAEVAGYLSDLLPED
ncbi:6-methylsalicylic acid synthase [Amycolatopsis xylanica]|uniref:6-methylsalicylic acid synthase n=1 Tax=Amycolatopsis xylanica TaxID=589385 RepID=A0A1H2VU12_9PSEU|nr:type I polyketide synthase [Amycolatopsis xylanica]SDW71737.1 6-methylsalicylic acid synthase [Amycolatopsis xylanica]